MGLNETMFRCDCDFPHRSMNGGSYESDIWINRGELFFLIGEEIGFLLGANGIIKTTIPEPKLRLYFRTILGEKIP